MVGQTGRTLGSARRLWRGLFRNQRVSCWIGYFHLTAVPPCSLSSSGGPGFLAVGSQEGTRTRTHTHTHTLRDRLRKPLSHLGKLPPLKICGRGLPGGSFTPPLLAGLACLSSILTLARDWSAQVHTTSLASGSLLLPGTGAAAGPLAVCLQVSPVLSLDGLIASRKGDFGKGTSLGGLHQPPNQNNKTKLEQEKKSPIKPHA